MPTPQSIHWHTRLRRILVDFFGEDDLETLCFDLRIDFENLPGEGKARKVVELIKHLARSGRIGEFIDQCSIQRPNIPWDELRTDAIKDPLLVDHKPDVIIDMPPNGHRRSHWMTIGVMVTVLVGLIVVGFLIVPRVSPLRWQSVVVDTMDSTLGWNPYATDQGASVTAGSSPGKVGNALQISFALNNDRWVGISKQFYPGVLAGTKTIGFCYLGSGQPNTLEFKLIYAPDDQKKEAIFGVFRNHATDTRGQWVCLRIPYAEFACWAGTGCSLGEPLDVGKVQRIDFAISSKKGDVPGTGNVLLDDLRATQ